ncbi:MAG: DUF4116 domain-containing protein, partial [Bacilli bacterium]|nr:DUF4116 domain-containing protein [Bacilli bacterium]
YASKDFQRNRDFVLEAVKSNGYVLKYLNTEFKNDKEIVLEAVKHGFISYPDYSPLKYASAKLRNDKEVVMAAVMNGGHALKYASASLRNDKEVVLLAVSGLPQYSDVSPLIYASKTLKKDKGVVLAAIAKCGNALKFASKYLKVDKKFLVEVLNNEKLNFSSLSKEDKAKMSNDKELIFHAIKVNYDRLAVMDDFMIDPYKEEIYKQFVKTKDRLFDLDFQIPVLDDYTSLEIYKLESDRVFEEYATLRFNLNGYIKDVKLGGLHFKGFGMEATSAAHGLDTNVSKQLASSPYAKSQGVYTYTNGFCLWWLRSPESNVDFIASYVNLDGVVDEVDLFTDSVSLTSYGIVPAL